MNKNIKTDLTIELMKTFKKHDELKFELTTQIIESCVENFIESLPSYLSLALKTNSNVTYYIFNMHHDFIPAPFKKDAFPFILAGIHEKLNLIGIKSKIYSNHDAYIEIMVEDLREYCKVDTRFSLL